MLGEPPVAIRMTEEELAELRDRAARTGLSVSAYLRAVDGGRASEDAQAMGITRGALVRLLALRRAPLARRLLRASERRLSQLDDAGEADDAS